MSFVDALGHRLRALLQSETARREREAEIAFHLSLDEMQNAQRGLAPDAARAEARRRFGNTAAVLEDARGVSRSSYVDSLVQDLRYAVRSLRRSPGYAFGAALTLAVGIGATTAVFSVFDTLVLRGVPYGDARALHMAIERNTNGGQRTPSLPTFRDWLADSITWNSAIERMVFIRGRGTWLDTEAGTERVLVANASPGFFALMETPALLGRAFHPEEERASGERVAVLSFDTWRRYYAGDPDIIGRTVTIDSAPTRIIGVMPRGFLYPQWTAGRAGSTGLWMPLAHIEATDAALAKRGDHADSRVVVRIRATSDSARAAAALAVIEARLANAYPAESKDWVHADLFSVRDAALGNVRQLVRTLGWSVALVLLLACINVANLSFVRGAARARELAVRVALGAGRRRVVRQLLTESVVIGAASAAGGLVIASFILSATRTLASNQLIGAQDLAVNGPMLAFASITALIGAMLSTIVPAFRATQIAPVSAARGGAQNSIGARGDSRIRSALVVAQLALALVLLVGTGLLVESFRNATSAPLGYEPQGLVQTDISPPERYRTADDALVLYESLIARMSAIPGVTNVAFTNNGRMPTAVAVEGGELRSDIGSTLATSYHTVSDGYLGTMKMQMAEGRWLSADDMRTREQFVVNETLARQLFPNGSAIGKRITALRAARARPDFGQPVTGTIIGVLRDPPVIDGGAPTNAAVYVPYTLETWPWGTMVVRTNNVAAAIPLVRDAIRDVDPAIPESRATAGFSGVGAVTARLSETFAQRRLVLAAIGAFAISALLLAAIGLYSVMSYGVSLRTREVGVRVALGATPRAILLKVLGEGARLAMLGIVLGCAGALVATQMIRAMLFGTSTTDVQTYAVTAAVLFLTSIVACYVPARRAAKMSPIDAIRGP